MANIPTKPLGHRYDDIANSLQLRKSCSRAPHATRTRQPNSSAPWFIVLPPPLPLSVVTRGIRRQRLTNLLASACEKVEGRVPQDLLARGDAAPRIAEKA